MDKSQISQKLLGVFVSRGYDGATLTHLSQATGLSKASLYHHFPRGKPEMAAHLVRHAIAELQRLAFGQLDPAQPAARAIVKFIKGYQAYTNDGRSDCVLAVFAHHGTASADIAELQGQISAQFADWQERLASTMERDGHKRKKAKREAQDLLGAIYGSLMLAKLHNDPDMFVSGMQRLMARYAD